MTETVLDPWEAAEQAKEPIYTNIYWGQVEANSWYCVPEKGVGRLEFDPNIHSIDKRRTAIDIILHPLPEMGLQFDFTRNMLAESREWAGIVLPSIRELGLSPRQLNNAWVKVQSVVLTDSKGNPITYTDANGKVKEKTTLKFLAIFKDEKECREDYLKESGKPPAVDTDYPGGNGNGGSNGVDKERATALSFLKAFVKSACLGKSDIESAQSELAAKIANQPLIGKYFTIDSPEVIELIAENMK